MTVSSAEEIALMLHSNIAESMDAAIGALGRLERQIAREQNALGRYEQNLIQAKQKLDQLAAGAEDKKAVAAFQRQVAAVEKLRESYRAGKASADELTAAFNKMKELKAAAESSKSVDVAAYRKQEQVVASLTDRIGSQKDKIGGLNDKLADMKTSSAAKGVEFLGDKMGVTSSQAGKLFSALKGLGPQGAAIAAGVLIAVAALTLFVGVIAKGISASSQMRREFLNLQAASVSSAAGQSWLFNATRESTRSAEQLTAAVNRVNATSAAGREKLAGWAADLRGARFQGKQLETTLNAMSIAFSGGGAKGEQMANDVANWAKQIRYMGGNVDDLAKRVEQKLGRGAAQAAISFDVQLNRLRENMTWIFGGADIDPLLRALNSVLKLFNAGSDSATGMRNAITKLTEWAVGMMLRLGIVVLKAYIALRQNETAWHAILFTVKMVGVGMLAIAAAVAYVIAAIALQIGLAVAKIGLLVSGIVAIISNIKKRYDQFRQAGHGVAASIVMGIVGGIADTGVQIWNALKGAVGGAIDKLKNFLDSHSPSRKIHREIGYGGIGMGLVGGMNEAAPHAERAGVRLGQSSVAGVQMGTMPASVGRVRYGAPPPPMFGQGSSNAPSGNVANFYNCNFGGDLTEDKCREYWQASMEGDAIDAEVPEGASA